MSLSSFTCSLQNFNNLKKKPLETRIVVPGINLMEYSMPDNVCCSDGGFCSKGMQCAKDSKGNQICIDPERIYCVTDGKCSDGMQCCKDKEGKHICITVYSRLRN